MPWLGFGVAIPDLLHFDWVVGLAYAQQHFLWPLTWARSFPLLAAAIQAT